MNFSWRQICLWALILIGGAAATAQTPIERDLRGGETHSYPIKSAARQFLRVRVEQRGVDVVLRLIAPDGKLLLERDRPNGANGAESLSFEVPTGGEYKLEIAALDTKAAAGKYLLNFEKPRKITAADQKRITAENALQDATVLRFNEKIEIRVEARAKLESASALFREIADAEAAALAQNLLAQTFQELGILSLNAADFPAALKFYERAVVIFRELKQKDFEANTLFGMGNVLEQTSQFPAALENLQQALTLYRELKNQPGEAYTLHKIGAIYQYSLRDDARAITFYEPAAPLFRALGARQMEALTLESLGSGHFVLEQNAKALAYFNQALALNRQLKSTSGEERIYSRLALVHNRLGELDKAIEFLRQSLALLRPANEKKTIVSRLSQLARLQKDQCDVTAAAQSYDEALAISRELNDAQTIAETLYSIADLRFERGESAAAIKLFQEVLPLFQAQKNRSYEILTLSGIAFVWLELGEIKKAVAVYEQLLPLLKESGLTLNEATAFDALGTSYKTLYESEKSIASYQKAIEIFRRLKRKGGEAGSLSGMANVYTDLGEWGKALELDTQALALYREIGDRAGEAKSLQSIAGLQFKLGNPQKSLDYLQQALTIHRALKAVKPVAVNQGCQLAELNKDVVLFAESLILNNIGSVYAELKQYDKALDHHMQALAITKQIKTRSARNMEAKNLNNIGFALYAMGKSREALDYFQQALKIHRAAGDLSSEAIVLKNIGSVDEDANNLPQALKNYQQALILTRRIKDAETEAVVLGDLALLWQKLGNPRYAAFYGKQMVNIFQNLRVNTKTVERDLQNSFLKSIDKPYRKVAEILIAQNRLAEAEQILQMLKEAEFIEFTRRDDKVARELLQKLKLTETEAAAFKRYDELAEKITALGAEYAGLEAEKQKLADDAPFPQQARLDELERELTAANAVFLKFLEDLKLTFGENDKRVAAVESNLQIALKEIGATDTAIVSVIVGDNRLNVIVTTPDAQRPHIIDVSAAELNRLITLFRVNLKNPNVDPRPVGKKLYDFLVKPIEKDLAGANVKTIIWSLDGNLRYIPVAALWDGKQYLTERFANASINLAMKENLKIAPQARDKWRALGVGVSKAYGTFEALPAVPEELCRVINDEAERAACLTLTNSDENGVVAGQNLLDEEFTLAALKNRTGKFSLIHVASHFDLQPGNEKDSFLLLGGGADDNERKLTVEEMRTGKPLFVGVEMLTLSACNTEMTAGKSANGLEIEGFGTLAQRQGAKSVLATLWSVADDSTRDLMTNFYQELKRDTNANKAEALRRAQISLFKSKIRTRGSMTLNSDGNDSPPFPKDANAPFAHPYFWSPFVLSGNWR